MALFVVALFAWADRYCGGGLGWRASFPGRPIYWCAPWVIGAGFFIGFLWPALVWLVWRWPSWRPGKMDPRTGREVGLTFARHCLVLIAAPWSPWLLVFPFIATALAVWLAREADRGRDRNSAVELLRGASYGLLVAL